MKNDFRWAMMVRLRGSWRLHWGPIQVDFVYAFVLGIINVNEVDIKATVHEQKVKITEEVIFEMFHLPYRGMDIEWLMSHIIEDNKNV